ncbi:type II toxin-antitoxin system VapC family toxin [Aeromicrobium sp.]|uniref:type II toxin-antitoxin system VapC family toxin n=1 Tax=Aeromicrobium sp. TaxID=1871063 RepID=UPI0039E23369
MADTGGIVAAINAAEPDHADFLETLESAATVLVTPLVVTEVHHILTSAGLATTADDFLSDVAEGFYTLVNPTLADLAQAGRLVQRYRGSMQRKRRKPGSLDLADAMNVVVAAAHGTNMIVATDQDYRRVTPLSGHPAFVLLPDDRVSA